MSSGALMRITQGIAEAMLRSKITTIDQGKDSRSVLIFFSVVTTLLSDSSDEFRCSFSDVLESDVGFVERAL